MSILPLQMDMTIKELNDLKDGFAEAYVTAIAAAAKVSLTHAVRKTDNMGIDLVAHVGSKHTFSSLINIQLKAVSDNSSSMLTEHEEFIKYNFDDPCEPCFIHYLFLVKLPSDEALDKWMLLDDEQLILSRCAYYYRITPGMKSGRIQIPKTQILTPESMLELFPGPDTIAKLL